MNEYINNSIDLNSYDFSPFDINSILTENDRVDPNEFDTTPQNNYMGENQTELLSSSYGNILDINSPNANLVTYSFDSSSFDQNFEIPQIQYGNNDEQRIQSIGIEDFLINNEISNQTDLNDDAKFNEIRRNNDAIRTRNYREKLKKSNKKSSKTDLNDIDKYRDIRRKNAIRAKNHREKVKKESRDLKDENVSLKERINKLEIEIKENNEREEVLEDKLKTEESMLKNVYQLVEKFSNS